MAKKSVIVQGYRRSKPDGDKKGQRSVPVKPHKRGNPDKSSYPRR